MLISVAVSGLFENISTVDAASVELGRGAIAGAFVFALAFLTGFAAIRRSGLAVCALLMVFTAAALEFSWLGFVPSFSGNFLVLIQALFAAAAIIFLSASVGAARDNPILGGVMFTAALFIGGMGLLNFFDRIDLASQMRWAMTGVGGFAAILALTQAFRGDTGARLILPGVAVAAAAPLLGPLGGVEAASFSLAPHAIFSLGILAASMVALIEGATPHSLSSGGFSLPDQPATGSSSAGFSGHEQNSGRDYIQKQRDEIVLDSQIARVLDYSGVAVWDWSSVKIDQTESLSTLLGADSNSLFTPDALRNFIHGDDAARFDTEVITPIDGPFDVSLKLFDGRSLRIRGARAADEATGVLDRIVAFFETGSAPGDNHVAVGNGVNSEIVKSATAAAIVPSAMNLMAGRMSEALDRGDIDAVFQPIVALNNGKVAGYEALARWRDQVDGSDEGPETFVRAAEAAGRGGDLARDILHKASAFLADKINGDKREKVFVAMNVSWGQISDPAFAEYVRSAISEFDLPRGSLVLELTEADAIGDTETAAAIFKDLKSAGVTLAFDDFGSGFTCLSNLRKFDFDYLKIDKSFTQDLESNGDGAKIVSALARLGDDLGVKVIIEGVETNGAAKLAKKLGCAYGQGFALGRPVASDVKSPAMAAIPDAAIDSEISALADDQSTEDTDTEGAREDLKGDFTEDLVIDKASVLARMRGEEVTPVRREEPRLENDSQADTVVAVEYDGEDADDGAELSLTPEMESTVEEAVIEEKKKARGWKLWSGKGELR